MRNYQKDVLSAIKSNELEGIFFSEEDCNILQDIADKNISPEQARHFFLSRISKTEREIRFA